MCRLKNDLVDTKMKMQHFQSKALKELRTWFVQNYIIHRNLNITTVTEKSTRVSLYDQNRFNEQ